MTLRSYFLNCLLVAVLMSTSAGAQDKIRVGFGSLASSHMVLLVAKEFGLFEKYHLEAEIVGNIPGAKSVVPLMSGDAQIIHAAGPPFVLGTLAGGDVTMFMGLINTMPFYLVGHKDSATPAQLRGKKMGVSTLGSASDFALRFGLVKLGLDPDKEVTTLALGDSGVRLAALNNGTIQAGAYNLGETVFLKQQGHKQLVDLALTGVEFQHAAVATTRSMVTRNRRALVNYAKVIIDAIRQMKARKEESIKIMAKYLRLGDRQAVEMQYDENVNKLYLKKPYPTLTGIKTILDGVARNEKAKNAKPEDFVELGIVRELDESGFIDGLYR